MRCCITPTALNPRDGYPLNPRLCVPVCGWSFRRAVVPSCTALARQTPPDGYSGARYQFLIDAISGNSMITTRLG